MADAADALKVIEIFAAGVKAIRDVIDGVKPSAPTIEYDKLVTALTAIGAIAAAIENIGSTPPADLDKAKEDFERLLGALTAGDALVDQLTAGDAAIDKKFDGG